MNYEPPVALHDYRYLGDNYRERYRIKAKVKRWVNRLESMPVLEQQALMHALQTINSGSPSCSKTALRN
jgi:DNA adenine methylase